MGIKSNVTSVAEVKQRSYPKLIVAKDGTSIAGAVFYMKSDRSGFLIRKPAHCLLGLGDHFSTFNEGNYEDFKGTLTLENE